jgi:vacuolar-type H+-ATPase subunit E/Vma4
MANIETKLNKFSAFVLEDALKQRDAMVDKFEKEKKQRIDKKEMELLTEAYSGIRTTVESARRENGERVLKVEMDMKKELIIKREHIIDEVFAKVRVKVDEYIKSPEYEKWLIDGISKASGELGEGRKTVYLAEADMAYAAVAQKEFADLEFKKSDDDIIGGFTAFNEDRRVFADYSLSSSLAASRESFLQTSGLGIG